MLFPSRVLTPTCKTSKERSHTHRKMTTWYFTSHNKQVSVLAGQAWEEETGAEWHPCGETSAEGESGLRLRVVGQAHLCKKRKVIIHSRGRKRPVGTE